MTATDVAAHQQRSFGAPRCTCKPVGAYHSPMCPVSLFVSELQPLRKDAGYVAAVKEAGADADWPKISIATRKMNKTEAEYGRILEAMKSRGEIDHYAYEGITLLWGDGMRYKPDFAVFKEGRPPTLIEVKGGHIWSRDLVRFKGCRAEWKRWFVFEMHQKRAGQWSQIG